MGSRWTRLRVTRVVAVTLVVGWPGDLMRRHKPNGGKHQVGGTFRAEKFFRGSDAGAKFGFRSDQLRERIQNSFPGPEIRERMENALRQQLDRVQVQVAVPQDTDEGQVL